MCWIILTMEREWIGIVSITQLLTRNWMFETYALTK